jgi:MoaA/NifB/PqqE/SkfB family radical SAM enzyme
MSSRSILDLPSPEPSLGADAYRREHELALEHSPKRRQNYELYLRAQRGEALEYLPIKLDIENVSRCNFRCTMCVVSEWPKGQRAEDLSYAVFTALIDDQYGLLDIKLQGIGEPLMQGDDYIQMIRYARAQHIWVRTTTNASLLHLKDNYKKLIDSGVNEVQISIDGADAETFQAIRRGSRFHKVVENCKLIHAYCDEVQRWPTKMWTVVQRGNCHQLSQLVDLASELGFKSQVFSLSLSDWGLETWNERNGAASVTDELDADRLFGLVEQGKQRGIEVRFWRVLEKYTTETPAKLCPWPFERAYVSSDLRVVPCCFLGDPDVYEIGKGLREAGSFTSIWHGSEFTAFRKAHLEGRIPRVCQNCYAPGSERENAQQP